MLEDLSQDFPPVDRPVSSHRLIIDLVEDRLVELRKVLDVLNALLQVRHLLHLHSEQRVERDLPVDVGLSLHEAACVGTGTTKPFLDHALLFFECTRLLLCQILRLALVSDVESNFAYDTVGSLTVARTVKEYDAAQHSFLLLAVVAPGLLVVVVDQVSKILHRKLGVTNHKLASFLIQSDRDVEEVRALGVRSGELLVCAEQVLDLVLFGHQVGVHCVHRDSIVIAVALRRTCSTIHFLDVVGLEDFVLIEREGILDRDVLNVAARGEVFVLNVFFFLGGAEGDVLKLSGLLDEL